MALAANWFVGDLFGLHARDRIPLNQSPVSPEQLGSIIDQLEANLISGKIGKSVLREMYEGDTRLAPAIVQSKGWAVQNDAAEILRACQQVISVHPDKAAEYLKSDERGQKRLAKFFMGELMKESQGKFHPKTTMDTLLTALQTLP
jgi:aspartyl-tRNA(Asn)/glutamyl-tRNA(Gln) amidotransferase subunit B